MTVGHDRVVDGMPIAGQFVSDIRDRTACPDLFGCPFRTPRGQQTVLGRDPMISAGPATTRAFWACADESVFAPRQTHGLAVHRQVDIPDSGPFLDLATAAAARAELLQGGLLDHELDITADPSVSKNTDVFETDQGLLGRSG